MFLLLAAIGLAFDVGRIYIARNESQIFVDAAAMTAAAQLDGTAEGLTRARAAVSRLPGRWNMAAESFHKTTVEFSKDGSRWEAEPRDPALTQFARVSLSEDNLDITFLRAVGGPESFAIPAYAVAAARPVRLIE